MLNAKEKVANSRRRTVFWLPAGALFVLAVALRWVRLDFMSFTFDHAAVAFRATEIHSGRFPFTGIVNSLGFRNAPGYIWTLLPVFALTSSPLAAAAWHGLLSSSMVYPLARLGQKLRGGWIGWIPAVLAAVLPASVFAGRDLWAQHFLAPLAAWGLWFTVQALDGSLAVKRRATLAACALAVMAWAVSVHFGALPCFLFTVGVLLPVLRKGDMRTRRILLPAALICATMLPSFVDFIHRQSNPLAKPIYVDEVESQLEILPVQSRVIEAAQASVANNSDTVWAGVTALLSDSQFAILRIYDTAVMIVIFVGLLSVLLTLFRQKQWAVIKADPVAALLIVWILVPALCAGIFLQRLNPSYFAASLPAGWLCVVFLPNAKYTWRTAAHVCAISTTIFILMGGACVSAFMIRAIVIEQNYIPGYYQPYSKQIGVADYLRQHNVGPDEVVHLGGPIFEKSYKYLVGHGTDLRPAGRVGDAAPASHAILQDVYFAEQSPVRLRFLREAGAVMVGPMLVVLQPSKGAAEIFTWKYYELPLK